MKAKGPRWISERAVLAIHDRLLAAHGGAAGLRDAGLFQSALAHTYSSPDVIELAAIYTTGIVRNHSFLDGNKRTGFTVGAVFLELNGFRVTPSEENVIQAVLALAAGELDESGYAAWLRSNTAKSRKR